jgi:hypothetical protein
VAMYMSGETRTPFIMTFSVDIHHAEHLPCCLAGRCICPPVYLLIGVAIDGDCNPKHHLQSMGVHCICWDLFVHTGTQLLLTCNQATHFQARVL